MFDQRFLIIRIIFAVLCFLTIAYFAIKAYIRASLQKVADNDTLNVLLHLYRSIDLDRIKRELGIYMPELIYVAMRRMNSLPLGKSYPTSERVEPAVLAFDFDRESLDMIWIHVKVSPSGWFATIYHVPGLDELDRLLIETLRRELAGKDWKVSVSEATSPPNEALIVKRSQITWTVPAPVAGANLRLQAS